jgi:hypothetical protein
MQIIGKKGSNNDLLYSAYMQCAKVHSTAMHKSPAMTRTPRANALTG